MGVPVVALPGIGRQLVERMARRIGAGDTRGALAQGIDGIWLAVLIGIVTTAAATAAAMAVMDGCAYWSFSPPERRVV